MVLACVAVTLVIETGQLLGSLAAGWAWRAFDVDDLLNNTVGAPLGLAVTGAVLLLTQTPRDPRGRLPRLPRVPAHRLVTGTLAVGLLGWALTSTLTTPPYVALVDACEQPPVGAATEFPGDVSAYATEDGSLCVQGPGLGSSSVAPDIEPGWWCPSRRRAAEGLRSVSPRPAPRRPSTGAETP